MKEIHECKICGVVSRSKDNLCQPDKQESLHDYCGTTNERAEPCGAIKEALPTVCGLCGRPAQQADLVCNPLYLG